MAAARQVKIETVTEEIIQILQEEAGASLQLTAESSLQRDVGLDSMKVLSLMFKIETRYDIGLNEEDADDLQTVGDLAALVARRIQEQE